MPSAIAAGEIESVHVCTDTSANDQPRKTATTAKGESLYSEIAPTKERWSPGHVTSDNAYCEQVWSTGAPSNGFTPLGLAEGQGNTKAPPQEELYDQPVSLTALCWDNELPYSGKFSWGPIFVDGQSSKFSRFNFNHVHNSFQNT